MAERLGWGLLSTARINRAIIPPVRISPRNELVAVASRSIERAQEYAREWNIPRAYGSYEALLADPEVDIIYNSLPNSLHAEWTIRALQAGKHVLCEKPLAVSLEQVDAIAAASRETGRVAAEAFMYRHHPQTLQVKELVQGGALGKIQIIRGAFSFRLTDPTNVRLNVSLSGGSLWDVGCYPVSYTRFVLGQEPIEVFGWQVSALDGVDETFAGQLRFPGDILAQFDSSFRVPFRAFMEIVGSEGVLEVPTPFKPGEAEVIRIRRGDTTEEIPIQGQELYLGEVEDMADAILLGKAPRVSLADSRSNVATLLALLQSAREGKPVHCPPV